MTVTTENDLTAAVDSPPAPAGHRGSGSRTGRRGPAGRGRVHRRHVRRLLVLPMPPHPAPGPVATAPVRRFACLDPPPPGRPAARVVRRPGVPLRHPPTLLPQEPDPAGRGRVAGRATDRPRRLPGRRGEPRRARHLRAGPGHPGRVRHDLPAGGTMTLIDEQPVTTGRPVSRLVDQFERGLDAPICLTWELTYACNLACVHCLSSSGRRDPDELSTDECKTLIDEFERMQIFYVNIGGGEPTVRADFWELVEYATEHHVGVKFSTNGSRITAGVAQRLAGQRLRRRADLPRRRHRRRQRRRARGRLVRHRVTAAMDRLAAAGFAGFKLSVVVTRHNVTQLDALQGAGRPLRGPAPADPAAAVGPRGRRVGRAPSDRRSAADPLRLAGGPRRGRPHRRLVLPPGRLRRRPPRPQPVRGRAGWSAWSTRWATSTPAPSPSTTSSWPATCARPGGFAEVWRHSDLFHELRRTRRVRGPAPIVRPVRRLPGRLHGGQVLHRPAPRRARSRMRPRSRRARRWPPAARSTPPRPAPDHSVRHPARRRWPSSPAGPARACDESPLACLRPRTPPPG